MFWVPELVVPIASRLAHRQNTLFAKPVREVLIAAIKGADVVHIYQPWPLGRAAERIARQLGVPAIAAFHIQPENITYNIGLGWFPPAAHTRVRPAAPRSSTDASPTSTVRRPSSRRSCATTGTGPGST